MSRAGRHRHRIVIQAATIIRDPMGGEVLTWEDRGTVWAEVAGASGLETLQAQQGQATVDHVITMRYRPGVVPTMRILHGGRIFDVLAVLEDPRHTELRLMAREAI